MNPEKYKYDGIYTEGKNKGYGHKNHGSKAMKIIQQWMPESLLDVGCGYNEFVKNLRANHPFCSKAIGVDFSCPGADALADATNLLYGDKEFDTVTAFDMLEHLLPEQVDQVLSEFSRISKRFIFSICYLPSVNKFHGEPLHPTVHHENWWIMRIIKAGGTHIKKVDGYLTGKWNDTLLKVPDDKRIILVGNGPSIMEQDGAVIDSFDEVIRFNTYHIEEPFTEHSGTKTTIWTTFGKGSLPFGDQRPDRAIYIHGENSGPSYPVPTVYRIPLWCFEHLKASVGYHNEFLMGLKGDPFKPSPERDVIPSSGLLVTWWLLQVLGIPKVTLAGFDHFSKKKTGMHHYWINKSFKSPKEHSAMAEAHMFRQLHKAGRTEYL